jgi:hypothetical protein
MVKNTKNFVQNHLPEIAPPNPAKSITAIMASTEPVQLPPAGKSKISNKKYSLN